VVTITDVNSRGTAAIQKRGDALIAAMPLLPIGFRVVPGHHEAKPDEHEPVSWAPERTEQMMRHDLLIRLKAETANHHAQLENALDLMRDSWALDEYIALLEGFYGYVAAWENAASTHVPDHLRDFFGVRRKAALLVSDLAFLSGKSGRVAVLSMAKSLPALDTVGRLMGSMYVMEGSTLGGRLIAPHIARLFNLDSGRGNAYFEGYGERTGSMWNAFRDMASATVPPNEYDMAVASAIATFDGLHAWFGTVRERTGAAA
jgi:heme oxygenase (biliverdin-IX-beta and delta-forming)